MAIRENLDEILASGTVPAVDGEALDAATVLETLDEHARLRALLKDAIAATPASADEYRVSMGIDEIAVSAESPGS